ISDFELAQLQDKLRETELVMENIVSNVNHSPDRVEGVTADQEESLLQQLTEITRVMQEGQMVDDVAPEKKSREDWEGEGEASSDGAEDPGEERESVGPEGGDGADGADGAGVPEDGVPEDGFAGVLEELELTLKVTSAMERVKLEDLSRATETEASCGAVRRRNNKRRRAKRAAH
uniref:Uncharacterized protein n=1 Tax=Cyclopterus lumpus TaxID=8103 RepID=A0A8C3G813_CYCLU